VTAAIVILATAPLFRAWTFLGRATTDDAAADAGYGWLPPVTAAIVILATAPLFRAWGRVFLGLGPAEDELLSPVPHTSREADTSHPRRRVLLLLPAVLLVAASIGVGAWPGLAADATAAAERFTDPHAYVQQVLHGTAPPAIAVRPHATTSSSVVWAAVSTVGSVLLGGFLLFRGRLSARVRRTAWRALRPGVLTLRSIHSGHVGDYVSWLTFGTALVGAAFALVLR
jgi:multicomponent Na+:H+ antiporter subunit D